MTMEPLQFILIIYTTIIVAVLIDILQIPKQIHISLYKSTSPEGTDIFN
jgi:hypothetical protein